MNPLNWSRNEQTAAVIAAVIGMVIFVVIGHGVTGRNLPFDGWLLRPLRYGALWWALVGAAVGFGMVFVKLLTSIPHRDSEKVGQSSATVSKAKNSSSISSANLTDKRSSSQPVRAPLNVILPTIIPIALEKGVPGYIDAPPVAQGERKLSEAEIRPILAASCLLCVLNYAVDKGFDWDNVEKALLYSLVDIDDLTPEERTLVADLFQIFRKFEVIREEHPLDDWICEAWWHHYQNVPYVYPSQLANAIAFGLDQKQILERCVLEDAT